MILGKPNSPTSQGSDFRKCLSYTFWSNTMGGGRDASWPAAARIHGGDRASELDDRAMANWCPQLRGPARTEWYHCRHAIILKRSSRGGSSRLKVLVVMRASGLPRSLIRSLSLVPNFAGSTRSMIQGVAEAKPEIPLDFRREVHRSCHWCSGGGGQNPTSTMEP